MELRLQLGTEQGASCSDLEHRIPGARKLLNGYQKVGDRWMGSVSHAVSEPLLQCCCRLCAPCGQLVLWVLAAASAAAPLLLAAQLQALRAPQEAARSDQLTQQGLWRRGPVCWCRRRRCSSPHRQLHLPPRSSTHLFSFTAYLDVGIGTRGDLHGLAQRLNDRHVVSHLHRAKEGIGEAGMHA